MDDSLEKIKDQIVRLNRKNPAYDEILNFYERVVTEQEAIKPTLNATSIEARKDLWTFHVREGFPMISKEDFILDIQSSMRLFKSLCGIGKDVTNKMREDILVIEESIRNMALDPEELLARHYDEAYLDKIAKDLDIYEVILKFLIHMRIKPSINANVEKLKEKVDIKNWIRGYCPICGSLPNMSELKGERGGGDHAGGRDPFKHFPAFGENPGRKQEVLRCGC